MPKYRTRALDSNGDYVTSGSKVWLYDGEAIAQTIITRLKLISTEYWRDANEGTPWFTEVIGKNNNKYTITSKERVIKNRILNTDGVLSITEWSADFNGANRTLFVSFTVLTEFGRITISGNPESSDFLIYNGIA